MIDILGRIKGYNIDYFSQNHRDTLSVVLCGYQKFITKDFTVLREEGRLDFQIIYITRGKGYFELNRKMCEIDKGNIVIYRPGQKQHYHYYHKDGTEAYWVHFFGSEVEQILQKCFLADRHVYSIGFSNECISLYKKIIYELQIQKPMYDMIADSCFQELLACFSRQWLELRQGTNTMMYSNIQKTLGIMHSRYNVNFTVKDLAEESNLSVSRFIHNFKTVTGLSPMKYLATIRIGKAMELLQGSPLAVSEIAGIVGYEDPLYFSRVFKSIAGVSPGKYRK